MIVWTTRPTGPAGDFTDETSSGLDVDWRPALDIYETADEFFLVLCVSGVGAEDLDLTVLGTTITISGRRVTPLPRQVRAVYLESPRGRFLRRLRLPPSCDMEAIDTQLANGQLVVHVPKRNDAPRRVPVSVAGDGTA
jgi:HSP20 family molecular chaperone IbpA